MPVEARPSGVWATQERLLRLGSARANRNALHQEKACTKVRPIVMREMATGQLVIVRHFEPPPPEDTAELLRRVYGRLLETAMMKRLTQAQDEVRIESDQAQEGERYASSEIRQS